MHFFKTHITGVISHGTNQSFQFVDSQEWSHDSDMTANSLLKVLERMYVDTSFYTAIFPETMQRNAKNCLFYPLSKILFLISRMS